jgi:hypothetical protein
VSIRYIELVDYLAIAAEITGLDTTTLTRVAKIDLAESALHAPAAGLVRRSSIPTSSRRRRFSPCIWRRTIHCPTATSALPG